MSTYMYLVCTDHEPPVEAEGESGQHHYDLPRIFADIEGRSELVKRWEDHEFGSGDIGYFRANSARFLRHHPTCNVRVRSEYGEWIETPTREDQDR